MSRARKPIEMQKAHLTLLEKQKKELEQQCVKTGNEQLKRAPKWLVDDVAAKEWRRVVKELNEIEVIGNLDLSNLGGYCNAYSGYLKATEELKTAPLVLRKETRTGEMFVRNPLIDIQTNYANEMRKFAGMCGLTIDSRLKVAVTKVDKAEETLQSKFGNI